MNKQKHPSSKNVVSPHVFLVIVLLLFFFGFFGSSLLHSILNALSGAPSVSFNVNGTSGSNETNEGGGTNETEEEEQARARKGGSLLSLQLEVIPKQITERLNRFEGKLIELHLINHGSETLDLTLSTNVKPLHMSETEIALAPGEDRKIILKVDTSDTGIFIGSLTIEGIFAYKLVPVVLMIGVPASYTLSATIPPPYTTITSGQDIAAHIDLQKLHGGNIDLVYSIRDSEDHEILQEQETAPVTAAHITFEKTFDLPDVLPVGPYYLVVTSTYENETLQDVAQFTVINTLEVHQEHPYGIYTQNPLLFFLILLAILLLHIVMTFHKKKYD